MGVGPIALTLYRLLIERKVMRAGQSIIELGSQDLYMDHCRHLVASLFNSSGMTLVSLDQGEPVRSSSRLLMQALGFEYECIDTDGRHDALTLDLNDPISAGQFDIVTNHGTTEHIFDQGSCFRNAHNLCRVGGIMIHCVPMRGYYGHCFYRYDPALFVDIAEANAYESIGLWLAVDDGALSETVVMTPWAEWREHADLDKNVLLVAVLRRTNDAAFVVPIQKMYQQ